MYTDDSIFQLSLKVKNLPEPDSGALTRLREEGLLWVYEQARAGRHLPMNESSEKSLKAILATV